MTKLENNFTNNSVVPMELVHFVENLNQFSAPIYEEQKASNTYYIDEPQYYSRNDKLKVIPYSTSYINQSYKSNNNLNDTEIKKPKNLKIINAFYYTNDSRNFNNRLPQYQSVNQIKQIDPNIYAIKNKKEIKEKYNIIKSRIINSHFYDKKSNEEFNLEKKNEITINDLLEDINYFGESINNEINEEKKFNPYITIEHAFQLGYNNVKNNNYKNEYFVLALLACALKYHGCNVVIEKEKVKSDEKNKELNTALQFLSSGMYNFKKYIFYFDFGGEINKKLLSDIKEGNNFNEKLKIKLKELFGLKDNDIIMTNPGIPYSITAIIKQSKFNEYSSQSLFNELIKNPEFFSLKHVTKSILLSGCKLNPTMIEPRANNKDPKWGNNEVRGGEIYYPPKGWVGYGLRVADRYDNGDNSWLDYNHSEGEWCVAYHGIGNGSQIFDYKKSFLTNSLKPGISQLFKNNEDILGKQIGEGMIFTPKPEIMEQSCGVFDCCGLKYKIGFMTRIMPKRIRRPKGKNDYWVINGTDNEIRPYRILIKEV